MTITITKYVRLTGGCRRVHSPIVLANLSRPQMIELIAYLKIQSFHAFISEDEVRLVIYKVIQEKAGLFGLKKENVIVENVSETNYIEVLDLFMPIEIKQVTFELDDGLEVIVDVGLVMVPIQRHGSDRTIKRVKVIWLGIQVTPENIFEWTEERAQLDKTYNPVIEIQVTPDEQWDEFTSEMYMLEGAIELPNGRLIGG